MQMYLLTKDIKYHTCIQTFILMCTCFWFWSDCLQDSCWCVCSFISYLIVHNIAVILFGTINVNESWWWLLRSPGTIGSQCTSSMCLQCVFHTIYKAFIVQATPLIHWAHDGLSCTAMCVYNLSAKLKYVFPTLALNRSTNVCATWEWGIYAHDTH